MKRVDIPMPRKEPAKSPVQTGRYVTIEEAAAEAGVAERTIWRWKQAGKVHVIRDRLGHVRISLEDVLACRHDPSESPLRSQVLHLQAQVAALSERVAQLEEGLQASLQQQAIGEQLAQALKNVQAEGDITSVWSQLAVMLEGSLRSQSSGGLRAQLAKRGLPLDGTCRLSDFAQAHQASIHEIKKLYQAGAIELTVYQRPGEHKRNKQEWWISLPQQQGLIAYWQQHAISYTACLSCPHEGSQISLSA